MMKQIFALGVVVGLTGCVSLPLGGKSAVSASVGTWKKHVIQPAVEGAVNTAVADDFDNDGHMDVLASLPGTVVLYRGPDWKKTVVLEKMPQDKTGKVAKRSCIHSTIMDVDGDGDMDYIGSNRMLFWLECPDKPFSQPWLVRMINLEMNGAHCVLPGDVDQNGKVDLIANSWRDRGATTLPNSIAWLSVPKNPKDSGMWTPHLFANGDAPGGNHYMGFGDVNKDGKPDIACGAKGAPKMPGGEWFAWWEQPADPTGPWKKHLLSDTEPGASNILPFDLNGDGHVDYLASRGHGKGVLWFKGPNFEKIEIDPTLDTPHSLDGADIDGDGDIDFASCSANLGGITAWYENDGKATFTRHVIDQNQSSYDTRLVDMDGDGNLDILIGGHFSNNVVWYENPK